MDASVLTSHPSKPPSRPVDGRRSPPDCYIVADSVAALPFTNWFPGRELQIGLSIASLLQGSRLLLHPRRPAILQCRGRHWPGLTAPMPSAVGQAIGSARSPAPAQIARDCPVTHSADIPHDLAHQPLLDPPLSGHPYPMRRIRVRVHACQKLPENAPMPSTHDRP
jgi:hypothetical protein